jgi:hypothetical protein
LKLQSKLEKCENGALAKSRQANISKKPVARFETSGEELMIEVLTSYGSIDKMGIHMAECSHCKSKIRVCAMTEELD